MLSSAELTSQVLPKAAKIPNTKSHVAVVRNISNVVVNSKSPVITGFFLCLEILIKEIRYKLQKFLIFKLYLEFKEFSETIENTEKKFIILTAIINMIKY